MPVIIVWHFVIRRDQSASKLLRLSLKQLCGGKLAILIGVAVSRDYHPEATFFRTGL